MSKTIGRIIAATENPEKEGVLNSVWAPTVIESLTDLDLVLPADLESSGSSYKEIALLKARWVGERIQSGLIIADDMGMEIEGLNGAPGIHTRRWADDQTDDAVLEKTLQTIAELDERARRCDFVACAIAILNQRQRWVAFERDSGILLLEPRGKRIPGHPLASLFLIEEKGKTLAELQEFDSSFSAKDRRVHLALRHKILTELS